MALLTMTSPLPRVAGQPIRRPAAVGFSLIEILVVITLIGLLMSFAAVALSRYRQAGRVADCKARIEALSLLAESYADRTGALPPSRLAELGVEGANPVNEGIEALLTALRDQRYSGKRPDERWLGNADGDSHPGLSAVDGSPALLEVHDPWGQPFVYLRAEHYAEPTLVRLGIGSAAIDVDARAVLNPLTGAYHRFDGFQLRSAGPDGLLDTEDDVANFQIESLPDDG